jgi:hypothetical protein
MPATRCALEESWWHQLPDLPAQESNNAMLEAGDISVRLGTGCRCRIKDTN